ncbi:RNA polymerase sigma factor [Snuella sedimenti]|uniref:RNA polymerase sigma-70 factor n=1 Tax=Snuella sedimenti TaxID=2798802 RepID=A0A8J7IH02_9FLAO|nr:RNA polymerase sigma-70 factor [Snuella sedimenti]MBJ6367456.1 RNA polymerase sigma-70 factor [Snuella sedimenti]
MTRNPQNERILLELIKKGDQNAFGKIFNIYYNVILVFIYKLTKNRMQAEDIVQETFAKLWAFKERIDINRPIKSYLYKTSYNLYIDIYRKSLRAKEMLKELYYQKIISLTEEDDAIKEKKMALIEYTINELPPKCKAIFMMSKFDGLTYNEISSELNISVKTVENQIGIALTKLRTALKTQVF